MFGVLFDVVLARGCSCMDATVRQGGVVLIPLPRMVLGMYLWHQSLVATFFPAHLLWTHLGRWFRRFLRTQLRNSAVWMHVWQALPWATNCLESYWRNWEKTQTTKPYEVRLRSHFLPKLSHHLNPRWTLGICHQCLSIFWSKQFFGCRDDRSMQHQPSVWLVLHKEVQFAKDSCFDAEKHGEAWLKSRVPTAGKKMPV